MVTVNQQFLRASVRAVLSSQMRAAQRRIWPKLEPTKSLHRAFRRAAWAQKGIIKHCVLEAMDHIDKKVMFLETSIQWIFQSCLMKPEGNFNKLL